jgi:hypothetical protein
VGKTTRHSPTFDLGAWLGSGSRRCWGSAAWLGGVRRELCSGEGRGTAAQLATRVARVDASGGSGTRGGGGGGRRRGSAVAAAKVDRRPSQARGAVCSRKGSMAALNRGAASCFGVNAPSKPAVARQLPW